MAENNYDDEKPCCSRSLKKKESPLTQEISKPTFYYYKFQEDEEFTNRYNSIPVDDDVNDLDSDESDSEPRLTKDDVFKNFLSTHKVSSKDIELTRAKCEKERSESEYFMTQKVIEKIRKMDKGTYPDQGTVIAEIIVDQLSDVATPHVAKTDHAVKNMKPNKMNNKGDNKKDKKQKNKPNKLKNKFKNQGKNADYDDFDYGPHTPKLMIAKDLNLLKKIRHYEKTLAGLKKYHKELDMQIQKIEADRKKERDENNEPSASIEEIFYNTDRAFGGFYDDTDSDSDEDSTSEESSDDIAKYGFTSEGAINGNDESHIVTENVEGMEKNVKKKVKDTDGKLDVEIVKEGSIAIGAAGDGAGDGAAEAKNAKLTKAKIDLH